MRRVLLALLLLLLGLEGGTVLTHKHKDGKVHLDCSVCVLKASQRLEENPNTHKHPRAPPV